MINLAVGKQHQIDPPFGRTQSPSQLRPKAPGPTAVYQNLRSVAPGDKLAVPFAYVEKINSQIGVRREAPKKQR
jgi:hypothetical protein